MKFKNVLLLLLIGAFSIVNSINSFAASLSANITGPGTVRAGDKITVTFSLNGANTVSNGISGVQGNIKYNADELTLSDTTAKVASPWMVEINKSSGDINFVAYDNNLSNPIQSNTAIFTMSFAVKSAVTAGNSINVNSTNIKASDGNNDINVADGNLTMTIGEPLSTNNYLASLAIDNGELTPSFSKSKTTYNVSVPFEVSALSVAASAEDAKAKVEISDENLIAGETTSIKVTVTAENKSKKVYTINVKREADPNAISEVFSSSEETSQSAESEITITDDPETALTINANDDNSKAEASVIPLWSQLLIAFCLLTLGFICGIFTKDKIIYMISKLKK